MLCGFVLKTKYDADKLELESKIPDASSLVKKTDYNTKITEIKGKIPDVSGLTTKTELTTVENKIPDVSSLVKKADYNTRVAEIDTKLSQALMVKLLKIKMSLLKIYWRMQHLVLCYFLWEMQCLMGEMVFKLI